MNVSKNFKNVLSKGLCVLMATSPLVMKNVNAADREVSISVQTDGFMEAKMQVCKSTQIKSFISKNWEAYFYQEGLAAPQGDGWTYHEVSTNGRFKGNGGLSVSFVNPAMEIGKLFNTLEEPMEKMSKEWMTAIAMEAAERDKSWQRAMAAAFDAFDKAREASKEARGVYFNWFEEKEAEYLRLITEENMPSADAILVFKIGAEFSKSLAMLELNSIEKQFDSLMNVSSQFLNMPLENLANPPMKAMLTQIVTKIVDGTLLNGKSGVSEQLDLATDFFIENCQSAESSMKWDAQITYDLEESGDVWAIEDKAKDININALEGLIDAAANMAEATIVDQDSVLAPSEMGIPEEWSRTGTGNREDDEKGRGSSRGGNSDW